MSGLRKDSSETPEFSFHPVSANETLQHVSAQVMAMVRVMVRRGICTEDDFNREFVSAKQALEEANMEARKDYLTAMHKWSVDQKIKLAELCLQIVKPFDPQVDVKVLFTPAVPPDSSVMFVRVVSSYFSGMPENVRRELLKPAIDYYTSLPELPGGSRFCFLAKAPSEVADDEACRLFDSQLAEQAGR